MRFKLSLNSHLLSWAYLAWIKSTGASNLVLILVTWSCNAFSLFFSARWTFLLIFLSKFCRAFLSWKSCMMMLYDRVFLLRYFALSSSNIWTNGMALLCSKVWLEKSSRFLPLGDSMIYWEFFFFDGPSGLAFLPTATDWASCTSVRKKPPPCGWPSVILGKTEPECLVVFG